MGYWKLSFDSIMLIREAFDKFINDISHHTRALYEMGVKDAEYYMNKIRKDSYYATAQELGERHDSMLNHSLRIHNRRMKEIQQIIDNFNFFIDIVEFEKFTSADFRKTIIINFWECVIKRENNPTLPADKFRVRLEGIKYTFDTYDYYVFSPAKLNLSLEYVK